MKVPYNEDLANHIDPESCEHVCKDMPEALTGESAGGVLSRERGVNFSAPTMSSNTEGKIGLFESARINRALRGQRPLARTETLYTGIGRSHIQPGFKWVRAVNPKGARRQ